MLRTGTGLTFESVILRIRTGRPIGGAAWLRPSTAERQADFAGALKPAGFTVTTRYSLGQDIGAACGQLARPIDAVIRRRSDRATSRATEGLLRSQLLRGRDLVVGLEHATLLKRLEALLAGEPEMSEPEEVLDAAQHRIVIEVVVVRRPWFDKRRYDDGANLAPARPIDAGFGGVRTWSFTATMLRR